MKPPPEQLTGPVLAAFEKWKNSRRAEPAGLPSVESVFAFAFEAGVAWQWKQTGESVKALSSLADLPALEAARSLNHEKVFKLD